ncbi:hypothetical protein FPOAC2_09125 [Fusarium poae]|jgi:hypothetical protein
MAFLYVLGQTMTLVPPHLATCNKATCSGPFTSTDQANEVLVAVLPRLARRAKFDRSYDNSSLRERINQRGSQVRISRGKHLNATQRPIANIYATMETSFVRTSTTRIPLYPRFAYSAPGRAS